MNLVQKLDTPIKVRRAEAFGTFDFLLILEDGSEAIVTLDMESSIFIMEHLDEGPKAFQQVKQNWFSSWLGKFKPRSPRAQS